MQLESWLRSACKSFSRRRPTASTRRVAPQSPPPCQLQARWAIRSNTAAHITRYMPTWLTKSRKSWVVYIRRWGYRPVGASMRWAIGWANRGQTTGRCSRKEGRLSSLRPVGKVRNHRWHPRQVAVVFTYKSLKVAWLVFKFFTLWLVYEITPPLEFGTKRILLMVYKFCYFTISFCWELLLIPLLIPSALKKFYAFQPPLSLTKNPRSY